MPPPLYDSLFITNYATSPLDAFKFRHVLDEPCRSVSSLTLTGLACPHVARDGVAFARLGIANLGIRWVVSYGTWFDSCLSNVLVPNASIHTCVFPSLASFVYLEVELEYMDPETGVFVPFAKHPSALSSTVCFALRVDHA